MSEIMQYWSFCSGLLHLAWWSPVLSMLSQMTKFQPFFKWHPLYFIIKKSETKKKYLTKGHRLLIRRARVRIRQEDLGTYLNFVFFPIHWLKGVFNRLYFLQQQQRTNEQTNAKKGQNCQMHASTSFSFHNQLLENWQKAVNDQKIPWNRVTDEALRQHFLHTYSNNNVYLIF